MSVVDILRAILIGQTCWTALWVMVIYGMVWRMRLRPGVMIGITGVSLGNLAAITYVVVSTVGRFGQPPDWRTILAIIAIVTESVSCIFIVAHLFFHDERLSAQVKGWFHLNK